MRIASAWMGVVVGVLCVGAGAGTGCKKKEEAAKAAPTATAGADAAAAAATPGAANADAAAAAAAPAEPAPPLDVMAEGTTAEVVIKALGEPAEKTAVEEQGADGMLVTDWKWPDKGLTLGLSATPAEKKFAVATVTCEAKCELKTAKGVGIGATVDEVKAAYGKEINKEASTKEELVVGEAGGGIFFSVEGGKVARIYVGANGE